MSTARRGLRSNALLGDAQTHNHCQARWPFARYLHPTYPPTPPASLPTAAARRAPCPRPASLSHARLVPALSHALPPASLPGPCRSAAVVCCLSPLLAASPAWLIVASPSAGQLIAGCPFAFGRMFAAASLVEFGALCDGLHLA